MQMENCELPPSGCRVIDGDFQIRDNHSMTKFKGIPARNLLKWGTSKSHFEAGTHFAKSSLWVSGFHAQRHYMQGEEHNIVPKKTHFDTLCMYCLLKGIMPSNHSQA